MYILDFFTSEIVIKLCFIRTEKNVMCNNLRQEITELELGRVPGPHRIFGQKCLATADFGNFTKVQRADLTCDVTSIRLRWFDPWPISDKYSNFAGVCAGHVKCFFYKITTLSTIFFLKVFFIYPLVHSCYWSGKTTFVYFFQESK